MRWCGPTAGSCPFFRFRLEIRMRHTCRTCWRGLGRRPVPAWESGPGTICAGFPSSLGFGVGDSLSGFYCKLMKVTEQQRSRGSSSGDWKSSCPIIVSLGEPPRSRTGYLGLKGPFRDSTLSFAMGVYKLSWLLIVRLEAQDSDTLFSPQALFGWMLQGSRGS